MNICKNCGIKFSNNGKILFLEGEEEKIYLCENCFDIVMKLTFKHFNEKGKPIHIKENRIDFK